MNRSFTRSYASSASPRGPRAPKGATENSSTCNSVISASYRSPSDTAYISASSAWLEKSVGTRIRLISYISTPPCVELLFQDLIDQLRIPFPFHHLHGLAHEEAEY